MATSFSAGSWGRSALREHRRAIALWALGALVVTGSFVAIVRAADGDGSDADEASTDSGPAVLEDRDGAGAGVAAGEDSAAASEAPVARSVPFVAGPDIVRTAELRVRVRGSFAEAFEEANGIAVGAGGFVTSSSTSSFEKGRASGELTLRVPADRFDDVRRRLAGLGKLESIQTRGEDVSGQLIDLDARLRSLRAEEGALDELLRRSDDIGQILQVRDRLTNVRTQIEQLAAQQAALKDQVTLATIHVSLRESDAPATSQRKDDDDSGLGASVRTGINAAEAVLGGMVITLGAVAPFLGLAVLAWLGWLVARRVRRATPESLT